MQSSTILPPLVACKQIANKHTAQTHNKHTAQTHKHKHTLRYHSCTAAPRSHVYNGKLSKNAEKEEILRLREQSVMAWSGRTFSRKYAYTSVDNADRSLLPHNRSLLTLAHTSGQRRCCFS